MFQIGISPKEVLAAYPLEQLLSGIGEEVETYTKEESFAGHKRFCDELGNLVQDEYRIFVQKHRKFF